jgi:hypothetical protein
MELSFTQKEILVKLSPFKSVNGQTDLLEEFANTLDSKKVLLEKVKIEIRFNKTLKRINALQISNKNILETSFQKGKNFVYVYENVSYTKEEVLEIVKKEVKPFRQTYLTLSRNPEVADMFATLI